MRLNITWGVVTLLALLGIYILGPEPSRPQDENIVEPPMAQVDKSVPTNLSLPFNIEDIDPDNGMVNPLGLVRSSKDEGEAGHSGIDIPLREGSVILAVADGKIVSVKSAEDPWGGQAIFHLLKETGEGEGWAFIYEHVRIKAGLKRNDLVKRGEVVGFKVPPTGFTAHFQLSQLFHHLQYTRDNQCWRDKLSTSDKRELDTWWNTYRGSEHLMNSWRTVTEEGRQPFKKLLNQEFSPNGLELCYPLGTDVR